MVKKIAQIVGWVLVVMGVLGFVPGVTTDGLMLGVFATDAVQSIVHLVTGAIVLYAASAGAGQTRTALKVFGIIYAILAVLGFMSGDAPVLGMLTNNAADTYLHAVIAVVMLYAGFSKNGK